MQEDHLVSVQMNTSKADVYIKLAILDNEEEQISIVGKGHVVIPSYIFLKDQLNDEDNGSLKRSSSRSCKYTPHLKCFVYLNFIIILYWSYIQTWHSVCDRKGY